MFSKVATILVAASAFLLRAYAAPTVEARQEIFAGDGTFYAPGLGACGITNTEAELVVAVSHLLYDTFPGHTDNPNLNPICGRRLQASYQGKSVAVTVVDKCGGCSNINDLDLSPAAFNQLADPALGRINPVEWFWL